MLSMGTNWQLYVTDSIDKLILVCPLWWDHRWCHVDKDCQTTHVSHGFSASKSSPILLIDCPKHECKVFVTCRESLESCYVVLSSIIVNHLKIVHRHPLDIQGRLWVDVSSLLLDVRERESHCSVWSFSRRALAHHTRQSGTVLRITYLLIVTFISYPGSFQNACGDDDDEIQWSSLSVTTN